MNRIGLKELLLSKLNTGLTVQLCALPGWGVSRWLRELKIKDRKLVYLDMTIQGLRLPEVSDVKAGESTTFILDHFDRWMETAEKSMLNHLRAIRDEFKYQLTYIVVIGRSLDLSKYAEKLDRFYELVTESVVYFPTLNEEETSQAIENIVVKYGLTVDNMDGKEIYQWSGGIPSLVKSWCLEEREQLNGSERVKGIISDIWMALSYEQQHILLTAIEGQIKKNPLLNGCGLVDENDIKVGALKAWVSKHPGDGKELNEKLTTIEVHLFKCLLKFQDQLCDRELLISVGWPGDNPEGVSDEALDQAISRLRKKVKEFGWEVQVIRGRGYKLTR